MKENFSRDETGGSFDVTQHVFSARYSIQFFFGARSCGVLKLLLERFNLVD